MSTTAENPAPSLPPHLVGVAARGQAIYAEKIRPLLTEADKGKYLVVNVETGEWVMDADYDKNSQEARERFRGHMQFGMRVGHKGTFRMSAAVSTELDEW